MPFVKDEQPWPAGRISAGIVGVRGDNPSALTYTGTNTYIVTGTDTPVNEQGKRPCLVIDPAPKGEHITTVLQTCAANSLEVAAILITHIHLDHTEGAPELAKATGAKVFASTQQVVDENALVQDGKPYGEAIESGSLVAFPGAPEIEVVPLPGHSSDSVGFYLPQEHALFTGDTIFKQGSTVLVWPDGSLGSYFDSLDTLQTYVEQYGVERFYTGHGWPIEHPLDIIAAAREHRNSRLQQVTDALEAGVEPTPEALFDAIYTDVDPVKLRRPALRSLCAQLDYLGYTVVSEEFQTEVRSFAKPVSQ